MDIFVKSKKEQWEAMSNSYHAKFIESGNDPSAIFDFLKSSYHALRAPWVVEQVQSWMSRCEYGLLAQLCKAGRGRGKDRNKYMTACVDLAVLDRVKTILESGATTTEAFEALNGKKIMGGTYDTGTIRNKYYRGKKLTPEVFVDEKEDCFTIILTPVRLHADHKNGKTLKFYGEAKMNIPK